jgi:pimeloyl-ACP methyl ester carboxylesterase
MSFVAILLLGGGCVGHPTVDSDAGGGNGDESHGRDTDGDGDSHSGADTAETSDTTPETDDSDTARETAPETDGETAAETDGETADTAEPPNFLDLREPGASPYVNSSATLTTTSGCDLGYDLAAPATWTTLVVLLHGLEREREQQRSAAEHLASWGLAVAVPTSCHASLTDLDQEANGLDAIELATALGAGPVIYAGHSAGGLAAFYAASQDPRAVAFLGLDPTEWQGIAAAAAPGVHMPAYAAIGEPGVCNLDNNFLAVFAGLPDAAALRVTDADHCDFEEPTDWVCTLPCGTESNARFSDEELHATVMALAAGFLRWQSGLDATGQGWWEAGGEGYELLLAAGAITDAS